MPNTINAHDFWAVSSLFSYPDAQTTSAPIPDGVGVVARALLTERGELDPILLENEYIRLFVNALPEVPCAPYGSVYLEGALMGASTMRVAGIYRKYGLNPDELPDHISVESEFLAWLSEEATHTSEARKDFDFLWAHFQSWIPRFLAQVEQHDQLGWYRRCAEWAKGVFLTVETCNQGR